MSWARVNLGDIAEFKNGLNFNKDQYGQGVKYISVADFQDYFSVKTENLAELKEDFINASYFLKKGDILFVRSNGNKELVGRNLFIENTLEPLTFSGFCIRARFTNEDVLPKFYAYLFKSKFFRNTLSANAGGTNINNLNQGILSNLNIPKPPLPTQRKIASILSAYDDLIENNLKRIKLLEEKAGLMFRVMQEELKSSEKINLYDFADIQMGFAFKAEAFNESGDGTPIIRIRDIPNQITKSYTTQEVEPNYFVEKGDLLIGMDGEFHMNEWTGQRGYLVQRVCRLRTKTPLFQSYLWQALKEPIHYYETTISGATVAHLGKKHLEEIFIAEPKSSMKRELEELNTMRKLKIVLADQNTKLREARDILLPKLMSGQIEV